MKYVFLVMCEKTVLQDEKWRVMSSRGDAQRKSVGTIGRMCLHLAEGILEGFVRVIDNC